MVERTFWIGPEPVTGAIVLRGDLDSTGVRLLIHTAQRLEGRGIENLHFIPHMRPLPEQPDA